jgi:putative ABC transport system permease protein
LREEIETHVALCADALVRQGVPPERAATLARARFGDFDTSFQTLTASARHREGRMHRREWLDLVRHDLRYSLRQLRRAPGFSATVVVTLALGIGANAVMFGIVDRLLLSPPPHVVDSPRVVRVQIVSKRVGEEPYPSPYTNWLTFRDLAAVPAFARVAAFGYPADMSLGRGRDAISVKTNSASASLFPLLGVRPALGRFFLEEEDRPPAGTPVAVIGYGLWMRRFGGSPDALGAKLPLGSVTYTIVGVAPKGFTGVDLHPVDVWLPVTSASHDAMPDYATDRGSLWLMTVARIRPGVSAEIAAQQATAAFRAAYAGAKNRDSTATIAFSSVIGARGPGNHAEAKVATWLLGVAGVVLLIACANVATLLLSRALRRRQEIAVRLALGVSRSRLVAQLLADSFLLAALGATAALITAHFAGTLLHRVLLPDVSMELGFLNGRVVAIVAATVVITGLLTGFAPVWQARALDLGAALRAGGRSVSDTRSRFRSLLLIVQAALSVLLLVGAGLFVRSLRNAESLRLGMDANRLVLAEVQFWSQDFTRQNTFWDDALTRVTRLPGVERAALTVGTPFRFSMSGLFRVPGVDSIPRLATGGPYRHGVSTDYFATLGARIVRGRSFTAADAAGAPRVVIINETTARLVFATREPLGVCVRTHRADSLPCATIVGVTEDVRRSGITEDATMQYYLPIAQWVGPHTTAMIVRSARGASLELVATAVTKELQQLASDVPFPRVRPYREIIDPQLRAWRLGATMFTLFGGLAFVVAIVGLYGVLAYSVDQRRFEFGVRLALGAGPGSIARLVLSRGALAMGVGLGVGLAIATIASRAIEPLLFRVKPTDGAVYAAVVAIVAVTTVAAAYVPSRRAGRTDPLTALRT